MSLDVPIMIGSPPKTTSFMKLGAKPPSQLP